MYLIQEGIMSLETRNIILNTRVYGYLISAILNLWAIFTHSYPLTASVKIVSVACDI